MRDKRILLIIGGGIAAYKSLILIRLLRGAGSAVTPVLTKAGSEFVTALSVGALAGEKVHEALFDLTAEAEMGHIELSRSADLIVVAPATADLMAKMATGRADDLASTLLLATDTPVLLAPAMNVRMWTHAATKRNLATLRGDGIRFVGPDEGEMACGEYGPGRLAEPEAILAAIRAALSAGPLAGRHVLVTSGPTHEPIDPVRYIANRSSGAQGTAIAAALRDLGARVTFVTGPAQVPAPEGVHVVRVETAAQMLEAVQAALPADAAVMAAAVADWRVANSADHKMKKQAGALPSLHFAENPDILATVSKGADRPGLIVGFAAETDAVLDHARTKRLRKGCDWILANNVAPETGIMGGPENAVTLITATGEETWARAPKTEVARKLALRIAAALEVRAMLEIEVVHDAEADASLPLPSYETPGAAGADLRANFPPALRETGLTLGPMERAIVPTGLRVAIPQGFEMQIRPRSGLAVKSGVTVVNAPGTIDSDYRGPLGVGLINLSGAPYRIAHGDRIAQAVVAPVVQAGYRRVAALEETARGSGGFGSTGRG